MVTMQVLRRFEFEPNYLLMSGVIAMEDYSYDGRSAEPQVWLKGAPHELIPLLGPDKLPKTWDEVRSSRLDCISNSCSAADCA